MWHNKGMWKIRHSFLVKLFVLLVAVPLIGVVLFRIERALQRDNIHETIVRSYLKPAIIKVAKTQQRAVA
jgi:hypothetical protein